MLSLRLPLALEGGAFVLPADGRIAVLGPAAGTDLGCLPQERVHVIQGFRPDRDFFADRGLETGVAPEGDYCAAIICLPRSRSAALAMLALATAHLPLGAPIVVDGQKTDGVDSMLRLLRTRTDTGPALSKAHGKLFVFASPGADVLADWAAAPIHLASGFQTWPGVFSADGVDPASALLAAALPDRLPATVVDLGAGWGYLSAAILARQRVEQLHLVEADHAALSCAKVNITDPRAQFHWADATTFTLPVPVEAVVMNPPFHSGRAADPALGQAFIAAAARLLRPQGVLWLVANRHLPYEDVLRQRFREVEAVGGTPAFKLLRASKPAAPLSGRRG
ncbi:class I SAM-dependent methyltransferase [Plastorhodobacter daqingensis]|uniref:Class I SAM-dependent methyltransferase n=1 Tax=Plastorhodobacter daqingensis TaxID=1387281 RepID=A0ABW2UM47_9RHOB